MTEGTVIYHRSYPMRIGPAESAQFRETVLRHHLAGRPCSVRVSRKGKRLFRSPEGPVHLSFSHSDGLAVGLASAGPCGVDVERRRARRLTPGVAELFHPDETSLIRRYPDEWLGVFSAKESYLKMLGCGVTARLESFSVLPHLGQDRWAIREVRSFEGFWCFVAETRPSGEPRLVDLGGAGGDVAERPPATPPPVPLDA